LIINPDDHPDDDLYRLMSSFIVPRPIAFVSTISPDGVRNVAPFSYFNAISATPPLLAFAIGHPDGRVKDTLANLTASGDYVVNIVTEPIAEAMNATAAEVAPEIDEFNLAGLTPATSNTVSAPRVAESPVNLECRLLETHEYGSTPRLTTLVIGEIVTAHIDDRLMRENGTVDPVLLEAVGRLGGSEYCHSTDVFRMERPRV
jgi:flavin reductase (DIM6/NTAB) family NADH-FMN oxidoreductase RutF